MPNKPIALFDLDGTLADFDGEMRMRWRWIHPNEPYPMERHDEPDYVKVTRDLIKNQPGFWRNLHTLPLGFWILNLAIEIGFQPHVLTAASLHNPQCWAEKIRWCNENIPGVPVTITRDKSLAYGAILVDDWPPYIKAWLEHRPRGLVVCPAHPWNVDIEQHSPMIIRVAHSITAEVRLRQAMEARKSNILTGRQS